MEAVLWATLGSMLDPATIALTLLFTALARRWWAVPVIAFAVTIMVAMLLKPGLAHLIGAFIASAGWSAALTHLLAGLRKSKETAKEDKA